MINPELVRTKSEHDEALTLTELSVVTGYGRSSLQAMELPLIHSKISLRDFWRVIRKRQDAAEELRNRLFVINPKGGEAETLSVPPEFSDRFTPRLVSSGPGDAAEMLKAADKLRAPRSRNARRGASHHPAESLARSTG